MSSKRELGGRARGGQKAGEGKVGGWREKRTGITDSGMQEEERGCRKAIRSKEGMREGVSGWYSGT